jgi:hypothetical protein
MSKYATSTFLSVTCSYSSSKIAIGVPTYKQAPSSTKERQKIEVLSTVRWKFHFENF